MANYADQDDLHAVYGKQNIRRWADIDGDHDEILIDERIEFALTTSTSYINDRLRNGKYEIPFVTPPQTIVFMTALYAGIILYDARQITSTEARDDMYRQRKDFNRFIRQILAGQLKFDGLTPQSETAPQVYEEEEE